MYFIFCPSVLGPQEHLEKCMRTDDEHAKRTEVKGVLSTVLHHRV